MKIVIDNNILLSGFFWGGKPYQILERVEAGQDLLFTSRDLLVEMERVLGYPKFKRYVEKTGMSASTLILWVVEHATLLLPKKIVPPVVVDDPSDSRLLECAWAGGADFLVTGDKRHLLPMKQWRKIRIVDAATYLEWVQSLSSTSGKSKRGEQQ